jgi:hypothetical protein
MHWTEGLIRIHACHAAVAWCETQPDLATAWAVCERGDWMLWLIGRMTQSAPWSEERKPLALCAADCAELALPYAKGEAKTAAEKCITTLRDWARGEATKDDALKARRAAAADAAAAYAAAYAAADAAYAAYAAAAAADAAAAAAYAAYAADRARARARVLKDSSDIVRRHFPAAPVLP